MCELCCVTEKEGVVQLGRDIENAVTKTLCLEDDTVAALSNCAAIVYALMPDINWSGFYLNKDGALVLGPFQGLPGCLRIPWGEGVCGSAASEGRTLNIPDVHQFPGHIVCDARTNSEVVAPLVYDGQIYGVLDVDSPLADRFSPEEAEAFSRIGAKIGAYLAQKSA